MGDAGSWKTLPWCLEGTVVVGIIYTGTLKNPGVRLNPALPHTHGITSLGISYRHTFPPHYPRLKTETADFIS